MRINRDQNSMFQYEIRNIESQSQQIVFDEAYSKCYFINIGAKKHQRTWLWMLLLCVNCDQKTVLAQSSLATMTLPSK